MFFERKGDKMEMKYDLPRLEGAVFHWAEAERMRLGCPASRIELESNGKPEGDVFVSLFHEERSGRALLRVDNYNERLIYFYEVTNFVDLQRQNPKGVDELLANGLKLYEWALYGRSEASMNS